MIVQPNISVIIPTYNYAQYICRCIGSVLTCGGKELEVIVVDDGSTDDTAARVKDLSESDKRIRYVYQDNTGVSAARNYGINLARGKWVFFVDGDDVVDAEMIRMLIPEDSTIQIIGAMMLENDNGEVLRANSFDHVQGYPEITFFKKSDWGILYATALLKSPCARAYNAEIIRRHNIRFDERVAYGEDLLFNLEYLRHISLIQLTTMPLYHYIKHGNSNSSSRYLNGMAASIDIIAEAAQSFCAHLGIGKDGFRKYCAEDIMYLGLKAISNEFLSEDKHGRYRRVNAILRNTHFRDATRIALRHSTVSGLFKTLMRLGWPPAIYAFYWAAYHKIQPK